MNDMSRIRALMIDVDDTIIRAKAGTQPVSTEFADATSSLLGVLHQAGIEQAGLTAEEAKRRIESVKTEIRWWHWSDFVGALDLDSEEFWDYAQRTESLYLEATGPEILPALQRLRSRGFTLAVTSNNPNDGIMHKLRVAGIMDHDGVNPFDRLLGVAELQAMKWEPTYWERALAHLGLVAAEAAVVGDNLLDDYGVPLSVGIRCSFIITRGDGPAGVDSDSLINVRSFTEIADRLEQTQS